MFECDLCGHEMVEAKVPIKVKGKRKVKEVSVICHRCRFCKNIGLTEGQILRLPEEVNLGDFQAHALLQRVVSMNGLKKAGYFKHEEEDRKEEVMIITA